MHQIQVDTIIVYIQTNTIPPLNPLHFLLGGVLLLFLCFLFCREDYNGITTFTELLNFIGKNYTFFINKKTVFL